MATDTELVATVVIVGSGTDYVANLADIEFGAAFGSCQSVTPQLALCDAVTALIGGAGGTLTPEEIKGGAISVRYKNQSVCTSLEGFDAGRADRVINRLIELASASQSANT